MSVILITGCSTGIGYATAEILARNGHTVYATMRDPQRSPQLQQLVDTDHLSINILPLDVTNDQSVQSAFLHVLSTEGHIDVLVNNAGTATWGAVEELPMELFKTEMDVNYFGMVRCVKAVLPSMRQRKAGCIINISTVAAEVFSNFHGAYCASKAAVEAFSECLAQEMAPFNVQVALVQPAFIDTPIFNKVNELVPNTHYPRIKRYFSLFAAALENHESPNKVADVVNEIVSGKRTALRSPIGPYAEGFLNFRTSLQDEDWINSVMQNDEEWINGMEQMGLGVRKYMQAEDLPEFTRNKSVSTLVS